MEEAQKRVCDRFAADYAPSDAALKVGIALATLGQEPINGLRHSPEGDTTGWYIWGGQEPSSANDFYQPLHVAHLTELLPAIVPYLGLPSGWRFQVAKDHEDVWFDASLLNNS